MAVTPLLPERHPNQDFFIADIFDALPVKNDRHTMEHPFFSLSTKKDIRSVEYEKDGVKIVLSPSARYGLPTMMDKDILLYVGSLIVAKVNKVEREINLQAEKAREAEWQRLKRENEKPAIDIEEYLGNYEEICRREQWLLRPIPKTIRFSAHDLMVTTNRETNGKAYKLLKNAFERLTGCLITTDIKTNEIKQAKGFHILESYEVIENSRDKKRMVRLEVTISDWFYNALIGKEVLTINREYFRLRKPLERRLYELVRKHCGRQPTWIRLNTIFPITV